MIGSRTPISANQWHGRFDEFRFSEQALTPTQFLNVIQTDNVLVDINADGANRNAMTSDIESAAGLAAGTLNGEVVTLFPNNNPGNGAYSRAVNGIKIEVSDITSDADGWFGAGIDNNLLDDGLYHRDADADPSATITLSGDGAPTGTTPFEA